MLKAMMSALINMLNRTPASKRTRADAFERIPPPVTVLDVITVQPLWRLIVSLWAPAGVDPPRKMTFDFTPPYLRATEVSG